MDKKYEKINAVISDFVALLRGEVPLDAQTMQFRPVIKQIAVAGSFRRYLDALDYAKKISSPPPVFPHLKDIELVVMTKDGASLLPFLERLYASDLIIWALYYSAADRIETMRRGLVYQGVLFQGHHFEIFAAYPANWGYQLVLRTGDADFNKLIMTRVKPNLPYEFRDGYLWHDNRRLFIPDEQAFFAACGLEYIPPRLRTARYLLARLDEWGLAHLRTRARFQYFDSPPLVQPSLF